MDLAEASVVRAARRALARASSALVAALWLACAGSADPAPTPPAAKAPSARPLSPCTEPRSPICTRDWRPVCAEVDTGVRCIKAPCPSASWRTFPNACSACADPKVARHRPGACEEG